MKNNRRDRIDVIATTISGSMADWRKIDKTEDEFRKCYTGALSVHIVNSHNEARRKAKELVSSGSRIIVSAGGAGTFNSILEGCHTNEGVPEGLKLAFLRKGSADLIGKSLNIPDNLARAVQIISKGIEEQRFITADIIEVSGEVAEKRHFIGFSGVGVFGDVPRFTENRFIKYYKGVFGTVFGDLGPFMIGVNFALMKHHMDNMIGRIRRFHILGEDVDLPNKRYMSIIVLNGDLGKDFPLAQGMQFGSGDFKVVTIRDRGFARSYKQLIGCWKGDIFEHAERLGVKAFRTSKLRIIPKDSRPYMVNIDGLVLWARGPILYRISDRVKLVSGR